ncbi:hypothetical protein LCGC14_0400030 [marine sediment metagenome]|uniref:Toprim domain-containing protein n=1 Tax=marine sediment metagenome TaxID=412755 RepID=A0A0F9VJ47_9ZZZZ
MALNEKLYRQLLRVFGSGVNIAKEGESLGLSVSVDPFTGTKRFNVIDGGEDYKVCCPFCGDTRYRLEISHMWQIREKETGYQLGLSVVRCYNDGCDLNVDAPIERRRWCHDRLQNMLKPYIARAHNLQIRAPVRGAELKEMTLPEKRQPLVELPDHHPAMRYLVGRGFNPQELAQEFELYYCVQDPHPFVSERIIIPIRISKKLVGWQARMIREPIDEDDAPKYYTAAGTAKNRVLYNYDRAKETPFGIVVEGVSDVWRVGGAGVAVLGSSISQTQFMLMTNAWGDSGIGLMLDPDFIEKPRKHPERPTAYEKIRTTLGAKTAFSWGMLEIVLPGGFDPGKCPRDWLWKYISKVAELSDYRYPILGTGTANADRGV